MSDSDEHARRFREAAHQLATEKTQMWTCLNCGKENRSNRDRCWKCETKQDGTPPDNPENPSLLHERNSAPSFGNDPLMKGEPKSSVPPLTSRSFTPRSDSVEVKKLMSRYWDAYVVARTTVGLGEIIKVVAVILAVSIVLAALLIAGMVGGGGGLVTFLLGVLGAAFVGGQFYLLGLIVMAQGQILKASLDTAVNGSPFLENEQRARIMSLK